jgi:hypothetical protein
MVTDDLPAVISDAKAWLSRQAQPVRESELWYAINNLALFISSIETNSSETSVKRATHALRHYIVDQFNWNSEHNRALSGFCERAERAQRRGQSG